MYIRRALALASGASAAALLSNVLSRVRARCEELAYEATAAIPPTINLPMPNPSKAAPAMPTDRPLVVVITGVTSGLGKALAEEFKKSGATVIGCGRREKNLADLREAFGAPHRFYSCDVTSEESVAAFANKLKATGTPIDVVIANAGNAKTGVPWEQSPADFKSTIETNLVGCFHITRYFLPILMEQAQTESELAPLKRLINISSGVGHSTNPLVSTYASSKWGVEALSKCTAQALRNAGFQDRVICVPFAPGVVSSEMNTFGWSHTTSEWAPAAVRFLLSIKTSQSGASLSLPGFYTKKYQATWQIPDGHPVADVVEWPA